MSIESILSWTSLPTEHKIIGFVILSFIVLIGFVFTFFAKVIKMQIELVNASNERERETLVALRDVLTAISIIKVVMENNFNKTTEMIAKMGTLLKQENECFAKLSVIDYIIQNKKEDGNGKSNERKETNLLGGDPKESATDDGVSEKSKINL